MLDAGATDQALAAEGHAADTEGFAARLGDFHFRQISDENGAWKAGLFSTESRLQSSSSDNDTNAEAKNAVYHLAVAPSLAQREPGAQALCLAGWQLLRKARHHRSLTLLLGVIRLPSVSTEILVSLNIPQHSRPGELLLSILP